MTKSDAGKTKNGENAGTKAAKGEGEGVKTPLAGGERVLVEVDGPVFRHDGTRVPEAELASLEVELFNFLSPRLPGPLEMRQLNKRHETFARHLSARLSTFLRMECVLRMSRLECVSFAKFREGIESLTHVTLFQVDPLPGIGILDISLPLAFAIADRLLGGTGHVKETARSLTEIETALVEDAIQIIVSEWCRHWRDDRWDFQARCIGSETSGRFLQTAAPDSIVLALEMEVVLGKSVERIQIGIPYTVVEVIVKRLQQGRAKGEAVKGKKMAWRLTYNGISVPVTVDVDAKPCRFVDVLQWKPGDIIEMPPGAVENAQVKFSNRPEFIGTLGIENGRVAVQLTKQLSE